MADYYGPQQWTAGTFTVTTPDSGDGNYPDTTYREQVKTVNAAGPSGERIIDTDDYGASAHDELITNFDARGEMDGNGVFYEVDCKFSTAAETAIGDFAFPLNVGHTGVSSGTRYMQFRVALTEGKLYIWIKGDGEADTGAVISADDAWHNLRAQIIPSSDEGSTDDGIVRVWLDDVLVFTNAASFAWVTLSGGNPSFNLNYVYYGHFGILPSTNARIYTEAPEPDEIKGSFVAGADGTVTSSHTALFNLDDVTRTVHAQGAFCVGGTVVLFEQATPPSPLADVAAIFAEDNGAGKTRLMVQFPTGTAIQIEIEP